MEKSDVYPHIHAIANEQPANATATPDHAPATPRKPLTPAEIASDRELCEKIGVDFVASPEERLRELRAIWDGESQRGAGSYFIEHPDGSMSMSPLTPAEIEADRELLKLMGADPSELSEEEFQELRKLWT